MQNAVIVLLSGKQGSGKTTLQQMIIQQWKERFGSFGCPMNFADILYQMHNAVLNTLHHYWPKRDIVKDGPLLQMLGTEWGRKTIDENIWVKILQKRVADHAKEFGIIVVGDCRFENEFDAFPEALRVRLIAPETLRRERCSMWRENTQHPSETGLDNYEGRFDITFNTAIMSPEDCCELIFAQIQKNVWKEKRNGS